MSGWFKRFGLHLAAAVGATGIFVAAAAVGATQTRQQVASVSAPVTTQATRTPVARRKPTVLVATPTPATESQPPAQPSTDPLGQAVPRAPGAQPPPPAARKPGPKVVPERSLAGTIKAVMPDGVDVLGVGGREWHVLPAPGALIRLNGKAARLDSLQVGDRVVILGQAQAGPGNRFLAHALTARRA